jgi:hypothetical protein
VALRASFSKKYDLPLQYGEILWLQQAISEMALPLNLTAAYGRSLSSST